MKYEVRMTICFSRYEKADDEIPERVKKSTIIDYIDAKNIADAYIKAARTKHDIAIDIAKEMQRSEQWAGTINRVSISLDAVVAKPELATRRGADYIALTTEHVEKLYNDLIDVQAIIKNITGNMNGFAIINWWLGKLRKLLADDIEATLKTNEKALDAGRAGSIITEHVCLMCGKDFIPDNPKKRHCNKCL